MNAQTITSPSGERLVVIAEADYLALVAAAEEADDRVSVREFRRRLSAGEEEFVLAELADRILAGENRIKVWRDYRGLTMNALAETAGISQGYLSQIEAGQRDGTARTLRKVAKALGIGLDDLAMD